MRIISVNITVLSKTIIEGNIILVRNTNSPVITIFTLSTVPIILGLLLKGHEFNAIKTLVAMPSRRILAKPTKRVCVTKCSTQR